MNPNLFISVLEECENANGTGKKKAITSALAKLDATGRRLMHLALDPYTVFGIRQHPTPNFAETDGPLEPFFDLLGQLSRRELTGGAAQDAVAEYFSTVTEKTYSYLVRVLDKDPRGGFSADTFNKVWEQEPIPTFEVMLADKATSPEEFEAKVTIPCWAAWKRDGQRNIAITKSGIHGLDVDHRARSGKPSTHLDTLFDSELQWLRDELGYDFVIDGEAFAPTFTETINAKKTGGKGDSAKKNLNLCVFFLMPLTDWIAKSTTITAEQNIEACTALFDKLQQAMPESKVHFEPGRIVTSYDDMMEYCNEVIDVHKQEGLILKNLKASYVWDRDLAWTKVKRFFDADVTILGFYPGKKKTRLENSLGGVVCGGYLEDGTLVVTRCGSGFSDELRDEIWNNKDKYLNQTFVNKYQEVTLGSGKTIHALRFGVFTHFRDDKVVEIRDEHEEAVMELVEKLLKEKVK